MLASGRAAARVVDEDRASGARRAARRPPRVRTFGGGYQPAERRLDGRVRAGIQRHRRASAALQARREVGQRRGLLRRHRLRELCGRHARMCSSSVAYRTVAAASVAGRDAGTSGQIRPEIASRRPPGILARPMRFTDVIARKRDGHPLDREAIDAFVQGATGGSVPDYQLSALLMAIVWRGMTPQETAWLTDAMLRSGERVDLSDHPRRQGRQAQHRRRGRQGVDCPGAAGRVLRGHRPEDVGPRAGPHRGHARQARVDPRVSRRPDGGRVQGRAAHRRARASSGRRRRSCRRTRRCTPCAT